MATYNGDEAYARWTSSAGTAILTGNQRSVNLELSMDTADHTGGTADYRRRKKTVGDFTIEIEALWEGTSGSAANAAITMGAEGTLEIAPLGSASGRPKGVYPVICTGKTLPMPFDGELIQTFSFEANGDPVSDVFTTVY
jgi:hypothetical protein